MRTNRAPERATPILGVVIASLLFGVSSYNIPAAGAQCSPSDTASALAAADVVFVGVVTGLETDVRIATVEIESIWKGPDLDEVVEVRGTETADSPRSTTDRTFAEGQRYLFVPENARSPFLASACSATERYSGAAHVIPAPYQGVLQASSGRTPIAAGIDDASQDSDADLWPLIGGLAVTLGLLALLVRRISKARSEPDEPKPRKARRPKRRSLRRDSKKTRTTGRRQVARNRKRWRSHKRQRASRRPSPPATSETPPKTDVAAPS